MSVGQTHQSACRPAGRRQALNPLCEIPFPSFLPGVLFPAVPPLCDFLNSPKG